MKIYFAGSIRGGREDVAVYSRIIGILQNYGEVLTEHIGDSTLTVAGDDGIDDRFIHNRDLEWLSSSDLVVAEVTVTSMGVGYEIGRALEKGKRVICLYRESENKKLSAMISGCPEIELMVYGSVDELEPMLGQKLTS